VTEEEAREFLSGDETRARSALHPEKRKVEWTAARVAAKLLATEQRLIVDPLACSVLKIDARPRLIIDGRPIDRFVSISHSAGIGAAAIHISTIGIDFQDMRDIDPRAAKFFLGASDRDMLDDVASRNPLLHLWCAKEAAWKSSSPEESTLKSVSLQLIRSESGGALFDYSVQDQRGTVETYIIEQRFILAVALGKRWQ
jgi:hypothetical protein